MLSKLNTYGISVFRKDQGNSRSQTINQSVSLPITQSRNIQSRDKFTKSNPAFGIEKDLNANEIISLVKIAKRFGKIDEISKLFAEYGEMFSKISDIFSNKDFVKKLSEDDNMLRDGSWLEIFEPIVCNKPNRHSLNLFAKAIRSAPYEFLDAADFDKLTTMFKGKIHDEKDYRHLANTLLSLNINDIANLKEVKPDLSPHCVNGIAAYISCEDEKDTAKYLKMFTELLKKKYDEQLGGVKNLTYLFYNAKIQNLIESPEGFNEFKTYLSGKTAENIKTEINTIKSYLFKQLSRNGGWEKDSLRKELENNWEA